MPEQWPFRFSLPPTADGGKPVTAEEAEQILLKQLETQERKEEDVLWDLAKLYSLTGRQILAFDCVQRLVEIAENAEKKAACHLAMGQLMEQMQDFGTAIQYYSQALTLEPVNNSTWYLIHNNLGYCLNHFGRHKEAEPYCRRAIEIDPQRHNAYKNLGVSLEGQGQHAQAAMSYVRAVQANASDPRALRHLEGLLEKYSEVRFQVPDLEQHYRACRMAVDHAIQVRNEMLQHHRGRQARDKAS
jgi:tetratricopeptide (TPR) repeat protein